MNDFTDYEKNVIVSLLIQIMEADNIIHPSEQLFLDKVIKLIAFDVLNYCATDFKTCVACVNLMEPIKKETVHKLLVGMAEADGDVDVREMDIINKVAIRA